MFPRLGIGVGVRSVYFDTLQLQTSQTNSLIKWGEVITENYLDLESDFSLKKLENLLALRKNIPIALHGVSMNLGSHDPLDLNYLKRLKKLISEVKPTVVSDHLCWTGVQKNSLFDLLPVPFNQEMMTHFVDRIKQVQDFLGQRILVENVSGYLHFAESEISEWEFVAKIIEKSDCGLLLDVNNVYVNSVNFNFNPKEYIKNLPLNRVGQIHLAGHSIENDWIVDTHDQPVCEAVWDLYTYTNRLIPNINVMIERDDNFPAWKEIEKELRRALRIQQQFKRVYKKRKK